MPINYDAIKREVALRLAQIAGSDQASLETSYTGAWASALDGAEVPASSVKQVILMIEKELAEVIGNSPEHPARTFLYGRSVDLANLASTPSVDENNVEFVGVFDSCADSDTNAPLTWQPTQTLADVSNTFFDDTDLYYYNITGNQIRHTRPLAYLQGCVWDYDMQSDAYDADETSPLPQFLANTWIAGVCSSAAQVGWVDQAGATSMFTNMYQQGIALLQQGSTTPISAQNPIAG